MWASMAPCKPLTVGIHCEHGKKPILQPFCRPTRCYLSSKDQVCFMTKTSASLLAPSAFFGCSHSLRFKWIQSCCTQATCKAASLAGALFLLRASVPQPLPSYNLPTIAAKMMSRGASSAWTLHINGNCQDEQTFTFSEGQGCLSVLIAGLA